MPRPAEHRRVPQRRSAERVRGGIAQAEVGLHLDEPHRAGAVRRLEDERLPEQVTSDLERRALVEGAWQARAKLDAQRMVAPS